MLADLAVEVVVGEYNDVVCKNRRGGRDDEQKSSYGS
uniref:Uncharacterized protein n=1 Tax=Rhizophora mucronata TaxID=61149 RepID=A0A2P2PSW9_RHIMU